MLLSEKHSSLEVNYESRRQYFPYLGLSHVLGYLGVVTAEDFKTDNYQHYDRIGKTGLELAYEDILRGRDGIRQIEVDALNKEKNIIAFQESIDGSDLTLTLDAKAQSKLYSIMADNASRYGRYKMAGVVLDAHDGGVLAMVSLPIFDNNIFTSSLDQDVFSKIINDPATPLLNRAIAGKYPFGSIFKPVVAAAALEEDLIDGQFTVFSSGGVELGNSFFPDWRSGGHGLTDVKWALADSVNTFFYTIGGGNNQWLQQGLGMEKIINYANDFGLGQKTDIDLNTEEAGFLPSKRWKEETFDERWYVGDTYNLSIGQGYLLGTPIQAATLMSYFTNGEILQPHFIKETNNNNQIEQYQPKVVVKDIISEDNLNILRRGLRQAVEKGTAKSLLAVDVPVAAKTGTAQFNRNKTPHSWLTAFAPYQEPEIIVAILVEEGGDQGVAVTVAREFLQWYF